MSNKTKLILVAAVAAILGAAYGPKTPILKDVARRLPKSAVL